MITIEFLAKHLHEAGRKAVEAGNTVAAEKFGEKTRTFIEWDDLSETAKDGRRVQAEYLLQNFDIFLRKEKFYDLSDDLTFISDILKSEYQNKEIKFIFDNCIDEKTITRMVINKNEKYIFYLNINENDVVIRKICVYPNI